MRRDRGLQPERTSLAWSRTSLSICGGVLALLRLAAPDDLVSRALAAALALCGAGVLLAARRRMRELERPSPGAPSPAIVLCLSAGLAAAGLAAVVLLLRDGPPG